MILISNSQKANNRLEGFGSKILKFCFSIKAFVPMLRREVLFSNFSTMIQNIAKIHKKTNEKTNIGCANF